MTPGSCAPVAGAHVHAPVRVRLRHTSAVSTVVDDSRVFAVGRSGATGSAAAGVGGATGSGTGVGAAAWGCGGGSAGTGDDVGGGACDDAGGGAAVVDGGGADAVRSRDGFELNKYHPPTRSRTSTASTAAIAGARDGSPMAGGALSVRGGTGTADDERSGKSSSEGGAARGGGGATAFGAAAFGAAGFGGAGGGGAGRGGGADDAVGGGTDEALDGGTDEAVGAGADEAVGAGDKATGGVSFKGMPRAVQNCSRFSRLVVTNGSLAGKLDVAMTCARR